MSFLRALRAYVGLGPDEEIEDRYLYELNSRRRVLDLDELDEDVGIAHVHDDGGRFDDVDLRAFNGDPGPRREIDLRDLETDDVVIAPPRRSPGSRGSRSAGPSRSTEPTPGRADEHGEPAGSVNEVTAEFLSRTSPFETDDRRPPPTVDEDLDSDDGQPPIADRSADGRRMAGRNGDEDKTMKRRKAAQPAESSADRNSDKTVEVGPAARSGDQPEAVPTDDDAVVRSLDSMRAKPRTLIPESFADAKLVADEFKRDIPVLLNLQAIDRELARRLIDFASGICYALDGSMEKIASQVFLLIPDGGEVSDEDRRRIEERGYAR